MKLYTEKELEEKSKEYLDVHASILATEDGCFFPNSAQGKKDQISHSHKFSPLLKTFEFSKKTKEIKEDSKEEVKQPKKGK